MRLIDADAYAKEMRERQDACEAAINAEGYEGETFSLRQHWEGVFAAFVEAKLTLDSMPTVEMPGWISVQDRLPENRSMCLTYSPKGKMRVAEAFLPNPDDYPNDCWWSVHGQGGHHYVAVTHWMPLPEPPKEVQDGT